MQVANLTVEKKDALFHYCIFTSSFFLFFLLFFLFSNSVLLLLVVILIKDCLHFNLCELLNTVINTVVLL